MGGEMEDILPVEMFVISPGDMFRGNDSVTMARDYLVVGLCEFN